MEDPYTYGEQAVEFNHMYSCSGDKLTATVYSCILGVICRPVSTARFDLTTIGYGSPKDRRVTFSTSLDKLRSRRRAAYARDR
jgi:hypothetical protein